MCPTAKKIIKSQGHDAVYIKTEDGYCPTLPYYHIASCDECEKSRFMQLELAENI